MKPMLLLLLLAGPAGAQTLADCAAQPAVFGCANLANLAAMVADPMDLERGRTLAPAKGDAAIAAVRRYRQGRVTPLPPSGTDGNESSMAPAAPPAAPQ